MKYSYLCSYLLLFIFLHQSIRAQTVLFNEVLDGNIPIELMSDGTWREVPKFGTYIVDDSHWVTIYANKTWFYNTWRQEFGNDLWDIFNLRVTHFRNGDTLRGVKNREEWFDALSNSQPAYFSSGYEKLYNFHAVKDRRMVCPTGSFMPSEAQWDSLINILGGVNSAGKKMKICHDNNWGTDINDFQRYTDDELEECFNGRMVPPLYARLNSGPPMDFLFEHGHTVYWSNSTDANGNAIAFRIKGDSDAVEKINDSEKASGYSIRCIQYKR